MVSWLYAHMISNNNNNNNNLIHFFIVGVLHQQLKIITHK